MSNKKSASRIQYRSLLSACLYDLETVAKDAGDTMLDIKMSSEGSSPLEERETLLWLKETRRRLRVVSTSIGEITKCVTAEIKSLSPEKKTTDKRQLALPHVGFGGHEDRNP